MKTKMWTAKITEDQDLNCLYEARKMRDYVFVC